MEARKPEHLTVSGVRAELGKLAAEAPFLIKIYDEGDLTTTTYRVTAFDLMPDGAGNVILHVRKPLFYD